MNSGEAFWGRRASTPRIPRICILVNTSLASTLEPDVQVPQIVDDSSHSVSLAEFIEVFTPKRLANILLPLRAVLKDAAADEIIDRSVLHGWKPEIKAKLRDETRSIRSRRMRSG